MLLQMIFVLALDLILLADQVCQLLVQLGELFPHSCNRLGRTFGLLLGLFKLPRCLFDLLAILGFHLANLRLAFIQQLAMHLIFVAQSSDFFLSSRKLFLDLQHRCFLRH